MMKIAFLCLFITIGLFTSAQKDIDILHYTYEITLSDNNDSIHGKATVDLQFLQHVDQLQLDLTKTNNKGKGMQLISVTENGKETEHYHVDDKIIIKLERGTRVNEKTSFVITYKGIPSDGLIISKTKYGNRSFFADNWPNRGHNWIPCNDDPADKAGVDFIVTAPQHYQVVANGVQIEETNVNSSTRRTHWKEEVPISTKVMVIGVADFAVQRSDTLQGCVPVYSWVYPENRADGFFDYAQANDILPFFIDRVGPYGFKKLANVQSKTTFGGLENANTIFYHENSINGQRKSEALLAHEIAHQWFGNMASEKSFAHLWLSEGFATYMTVLYMENKYGVDTARAMLLQDRQQVINFVKRSNRPVVDDTTNYMALLNDNSYQKGSWVLHMLRRELGDAIFWKSIRSYYQLYAGKTADTEDLQQVFEKVSGKKLDVFFRQWLYTPRIPQLAISWKWLEKERKIEIVVKQEQSSGAFQFPLEMAIIDSKGQSKTETIQVKENTGTFTIPCNDKPAQIQFDPNWSLLFENKSAR